MEEGESILDAIYEDDNLDDAEDVEMLDVEEGELVENKSRTNLEQNNNGGDNVVNQGSQTKNRRRKAKKKKNKKKRSGPGPNVTDINRFVLDTCRRLKEKKSYMVYSAVGCLGISALSELVKEVGAIQSCGGQMTVDGRRPRTGGGILWNIMKAREPLAYKEIMKKVKEFEKQFKQQNILAASGKNQEDSSQENASAVTHDTPTGVLDCSQIVPCDQHEQSSADEKRRSVHHRMRVPVLYDDLLGDDPEHH